MSVWHFRQNGMKVKVDLVYFLSPRFYWMTWYDKLHPSGVPSRLKQAELSWVTPFLLEKPQTFNRVKGNCTVTWFGCRLTSDWCQILFETKLRVCFNFLEAPGGWSWPTGNTQQMLRVVDRHMMYLRANLVSLSSDWHLTLCSSLTGVK